MRFSDRFQFAAACALVLAGSGLVSVSALEQVGPQNLTTEDAVAHTLADSVETWVNSTQFSGQVLISRAGETVYELNTGLADRDTGTPITAQSRFAIASLSKTFTTVLALQAVEAGQLSLDDTLSDWLPEYDAPYADVVTVRHLLQNRSGIPHYIDLPDWFTPQGKAAYTPDHLLNTLSDLPLQFEPGSDYLYSNSNFYLVGLILDRATGQTYEDHLAQTLLEPLDLTSTGQIYETQGRVGLAHNYLPTDNGEYERIEIVNPAVFRATASLSSNARDLQRWGEAIMDGDLLDTDSSDIMLDVDRPMAWTLAQLPVEHADTPITLQTYNGRLVGHTSMLTLLPDSETIIIVLSNNAVAYSELAELTVELAGLVSTPED
ncbi:serine hydrolase domain-containing protein [Maricaulis sp. D1M11]|uniref:serine hydrolase domain-containing protein n=1 Tax=Maricaulis sp. D1M11 TaxID=3076117 RepID=UPI0039B616B2